MIGLDEGFVAPEAQPDEFSFAGFVFKWLTAREELAILVLI